MVAWGKINNLVFNAGKHRQPDQLAEYVFHHLNEVVDFDNAVMIALTAAGDLRPAFSQNIQSLQPQFWKRINANYYRHFPTIQECLVSMNSSQSPAIRDYWQQAGITAALGMGLWDPHGNIRYLFSLTRKSQVPFTVSDEQTIQIIFRQLNNLYQNLLTTLQPLRLKASYQLTNRERDVANLLMAGLDNDEIAAKLFISKATVTKHIANLHRKLHVQSQTQLLAKLFQDN
jgi:DNA-binding CsgD family transcriptional regulator